MRMLPGAHLPLKNKHGTAMLAKGKPAAKVAHFSAPFKGLSRNAELSDTDPLQASILTNWVVEDDRITVRPGYKKLGQIAGQIPANTAISTIIPYYGGPTQKLVFAAGEIIYDMSGTSLAGPFVGATGVWAWTSFSNLSAVDYTVMCNGVNGVWSWPGGDGTTFVNEAITAPPAETWVNVNKFDKVLSHMNRLWFADSENLAVHYLPIQVKSGPLEGMLLLNAIFKRGGYIRGIYTWSIDGGVGLDDAIAIFTSNGEVAIYSGVNPEAEDFKLVGVFRFDAPLSKDSIINFGGDLYVMISTGLVPMTTLIRAETEQLGKSDLNVMKDFEDVARYHRNEFGWQAMLNHHTNHAICNMPIGGGKYQQMVRKMPGQVWSKWSDIPARCWGWLDNHAYFGSEAGGIYLAGPEYTNDDGKAIDADVRFAWSSFKSMQKKNFKMVRLYVLTDGQPRPFIDLEVDYNNVPPTNQPEITFGPAGGANWDTGSFGTPALDYVDADFWAMSLVPRQNWQGVTGLGRVGATRVRVSISGAVFSLTGVDVIYELGGLM